MSRNHENKSRSVTLRFTKESYGSLKRKASRAGVSLSSYIRNRIASGSFSRPSDDVNKRLLTSSEEHNATCSKIRRVTSNLGNDLNQAMRAINARVIYGKSTSNESLAVAIKRTQEQLRKVTAEISKIERRV